MEISTTSNVLTEKYSQIYITKWKNLYKFLNANVKILDKLDQIFYSIMILNEIHRDKINKNKDLSAFYMKIIKIWKT